MRPHPCQKLVHAYTCTLHLHVTQPKARARARVRACILPDQKLTHMPTAAHHLTRKSSAHPHAHPARAHASPNQKLARTPAPARQPTKNLRPRPLPTKNSHLPPHPGVKQPETCESAHAHVSADQKLARTPTHAHACACARPETCARDLCPRALLHVTRPKTCISTGQKPARLSGPTCHPTRNWCTRLRPYISQPNLCSRPHVTRPKTRICAHAHVPTDQKLARLPTPTCWPTRNPHACAHKCASPNQKLTRRGNKFFCPHPSPHPLQQCSCHPALSSHVRYPWSLG